MKYQYTMERLGQVSDALELLEEAISLLRDARKHAPEGSDLEHDIGVWLRSVGVDDRKSGDPS